jgi:hypothetical protein
MTDLKNGHTSLTNDMENVVEYEIHTQGFTPHGIVYRDSAGYWDGWDPHGHSFVLLKWPMPLTAEDAMLQYIRLTGPPQGRNKYRRPKPHKKKKR